MDLNSDYSSRSPDDLRHLPHFDEREIELRWHKDWWDGPQTGAISFQGQVYWFQIYCDSDEPPYPSYFLAYLLSAEETVFADRWSAEHERLRTEWMPLANDPNNQNSRELTELTAKWKAHDECLPDYANREPAAWFRTGSNPSFSAVQLTRNPTSEL